MAAESPLPRIRRARGYHLYSDAGRRLLDLYLDGGAALLGHRPDQLGRQLKGVLGRGLIAPLPSRYGAHLLRALRQALPAHRWFGVAATRAAALELLRRQLDLPALPPVADPLLDPEWRQAPVAWWRPLSGEQPAGGDWLERGPAALVHRLPFAIGAGPVTVSTRAAVTADPRRGSAVDPTGAAAPGADAGGDPSGGIAVAAACAAPGAGAGDPDEGVPHDPSGVGLSDINAVGRSGGDPRGTDGEGAVAAGAAGGDAGEVAASDWAASGMVGAAAARVGGREPGEAAVIDEGVAGVADAVSTAAVAAAGLAGADATSPLLLAGAAVALHRLLRPAELQRVTAPGSWPQAAPGWRRSGVYVVAEFPSECYAAVHAAFLAAGVLLNPTYPGPSILPGSASPGEWALLRRLFLAHPGHQTGR